MINADAVLPGQRIYRVQQRIDYSLQAELAVVSAPDDIALLQRCRIFEIPDLGPGNFQKSDHSFRIDIRPKSGILEKYALFSRARQPPDNETFGCRIEN